MPRPTGDRGASPAISPSGMPMHDRQHERHEGELQRRRHAAQDQVDRRHAVHERAAEIAGERRLDEQPELHPQRLVEAEPLDRPLALDLVGVGADQDVDRIAERVDADEHQRRHHDDHEQALAETAEQECQHGGPRTNPRSVTLYAVVPRKRGPSIQRPTRAALDPRFRGDDGTAGITAPA